jgi:hypothetical protein
MKVPDAAYKRLKGKLWDMADKLNWPTLSDQQKSALYEEWIRDDTLGGVLARYLDPANVRVYIKDTIMKPYGRERIKDFPPIQTLLGIPDSSKVAETYIKPHGRRLDDGRVVCWGLSRDWKAILFAVFERAHLAHSGVPFAAVIMFPAGKCQQLTYRRMIETAAEKLGIARLVWHDS